MTNKVNRCLSGIPSNYPITQFILTRLATIQLIQSIYPSITKFFFFSFFWGPNWRLDMSVFVEKGKASEHGKNQQQTQSHMAPGWIEHAPHLWRASSLITAALSLLPQMITKLINPSTDRTAFYFTQKGTVNKPNDLSPLIHFSARFMEKLKEPVFFKAIC